MKTINSAICFASDGEQVRDFYSDSKESVSKEIKKMNYRIKIITYKSGKQEFYPQVKKGLFWIGLYYDGEASIFARDSYRNTRASALEAIDLHDKGNHKKQTIKFEYIK